MFKEALEEFEKYRQSQFNKTGGISYYEAEIGNKLSQLSWLIAHAERLTKRVLESQPKINGSEIEQPENPFDFNSMRELEIFTESFYHFAWRIIEIARKHDSFFKDELDKTQVVRVRNNLIQHPEAEETKGKGKFFPMFSTSDDRGPVIKGYVGPDGSYDDEGLFVNAKEFADGVVKAIARKREDG